MFDLPTIVPFKFLKLPVPVTDAVSGDIVKFLGPIFSFVKVVPVFTDPEKLPVVQRPFA